MCVIILNSSLFGCNAKNQFSNDCALCDEEVKKILTRINYSKLIRKFL